MQVSKTPFSYPKTYTILWNFWNFFLFSKNMDYHIQFLDFLSLFKKRGLSYAIFRSYYPISKNLDYHIKFLEFFPFSINVDYHMQVSRILFPSPKRWTIICNIWNFFLFSKNMNCRIQLLEFLSLFKKRRLSYAIFRSYYPFS